LEHPSSGDAEIKNSPPGTVEKPEVNLEMPKVKDFYVSTAFRLWIATEPHKSLQISLLQDSNKIVLEKAKALKLNAAKLFNSMPKEFIAICPEQAGPLYFAITFYHSVLVERNKFGSVGWSRPYEFTRADNQLASFLML
jgi:dynein heavy chain